MQFLPKGAMNNVVPIYASTKTSERVPLTPVEGEVNWSGLTKVGSAWKRRRQLIMRIDIYQNTLDKYISYRTSDGQIFLPVLIPMQKFLNLGTREDFSGKYADEDEMELVGYIRASHLHNSAENSDPNPKYLKASLNVDSILGGMAPDKYGNSMFAVVPMNSIEGIRDGTRAVGAVSMKVDPSMRSDVRTPFLINRDLVRFR